MDYKELLSKAEKELASTRERIAVVKSDVQKLVTDLNLVPSKDLKEQVEARMESIKAEEDKIVESIDNLLKQLEDLDTDATESMGQN